MLAPRWRFWIYEQPAIVLGCSQRALHARLQAATGMASAEVLLRESGGGAVLAGPWMVGLSLVLPLGHPWLAQGLVDTYRHLGQLYATVLVSQGVPARALSPSELPGQEAALTARGLAPADWACFGSLSPWEVVDAQGRKLVGLAQRRSRTGVLLVAGLLVAESPWAVLCGALERADDTTVLRQRTAHCAAWLTPAEGQACVQMLQTQVRRAVGVGAMGLGACRLQGGVAG